MKILELKLLKGNKYISITVFIAIVVLPVAASLLYSIRYSLGLTGLLSDGFTFHHWSATISEGYLFQSILYSFYIAVVSIIMSVTIALLIAWRYQKALQSNAIAWLLFLPLAIPAVVAAFFSYQMLSPSGVLSRIAALFHWIDAPSQFPNLINDSPAFGIIITHIILAVPYFVILFRNIIREERVAELMDVAANLGADTSIHIRKILIPLVVKKAAASIFMFSIFIAGSYEIPLLLGASDKRMLSPLIADKMFKFDLGDKPEAHVMLVVYVVFILVINLVMFRKVNRYAA